MSRWRHLVSIVSIGTYLRTLLEAIRGKGRSDHRCIVTSRHQLAETLGFTRDDYSVQAGKVCSYWRTHLTLVRAQVAAFPPTMCWSGNK
ncbi:hypothetical protein GGR58DRAFT_460904 [Xylaria digitata]|nr:hypothetical protein GGR58DRAFT_460904 [Xylaria digitata]